jgi:ABC-type uncharacterized transport system involved in gliding motility auxiliary subunit
MMKIEWRRYAPFGLYLSLLSVLIAAGLYIVYRAWNLPLQISLGVAIIGLALYAILDPDQLREAITGRQARYGSNAVVLSLAFIGIMVVANFLIYKYPKRWDLTENQQFTLAPETQQALDSLEQPVTALAFYTNRVSASQKETAEGLLDQYKFHSNGKFDYSFINPEADPVAAQAAKVDRDGTIVLKMGDQQEKLSFVEESEMTGALVRLMNPQKPVLYFISGHGEYNPDDSGDQSYSQVKSTLESKNYVVKTLNLLAENKIPDDARVIVIAGPTQPVTQEEIELIKAFVDGGGALLALEEPLPLTKFGEAADPLRDYLALDWGILLGKDIVVDLSSNQPFLAFANRYGNHLITKKMGNVAAFFPTSRSVTSAASQSGTIATPLIYTSDQSWAETDLAALQTGTQTEGKPQIQPDEGVDLIGSVILAMAGENSTTRGRVVVFGDSDFASNTYVSQFGNRDMFVNAIDWAAEQENLISLTPKENKTRMLVTPQPLMMNLILLGSVFLLPGLVLGAGILVWIQRRRRG